MSPTITETAEAFSRHQFEETYPFMLDEAEWTLVGGNQLRGKTNIVKACQESASDLGNAKTSFSRFKVITTDDCVVIDSRAEYINGDGESSPVASCDIYEFIDGYIAAITSYNELKSRADGTRAFLRVASERALTDHLTGFGCPSRIHRSTTWRQSLSGLARLTPRPESEESRVRREMG